ncbi:MAG: nucleotidyltransferase family protein [Armatimonadota bacterium]
MQKSLKVVLIPDYTPTNPYQRELAAALKSHGVQATASNGGRWLPTLRAAWMNGRPDVLHIHWSEFLWLAPSRPRAVIRALRFVSELTALKLSGPKIVWTVHNLFEHEGRHPRLEAPLTRFLARLCDHMIVHDSHAREVLIRALRLPDRLRNRISLIPHGHYIQSYPNQMARVDARAALGLAREEFVFLHFGQMRPYKGTTELISAFRKLEWPYARLLVVGKPANKRIHAELTDACTSDYRMRAILEFIRDEEIQVYMNAADVVVLPYRDVLTPGSAILAMSFAKPLIVPRRGCVSEVLDDRGGFVYDPDDDRALPKAMEMAADADLPAMGRYNYERVRKWDWNEIGRRTSEVYQACVGARMALPRQRQSAFDRRESSRKWRAMTLRAEEEFVKHRLSFDWRALPRNESLSYTQIDWDRILSIAARQRVVGLLYQALSSQRTTAVPDSVLQTLEDASSEIAARNRAHRQALQAVSGAFRAAGLPFVLLKGVALLGAIHTDAPDLRSCRDMDILVRKDDLARVHEVLVTLRYHPLTTPWKARDRTYQMPEYGRPNEPVRIDVHYDLIEPDVPLRIDIDEFWQRARSVTLDGQEMLVFCAEDMVLHRAIHLSCHKEFVLDTLRQVRDLGEIITTFSIRWDAVCGLAHRYHAHRSLYYSLRLARNLLQAPVPDEVLLSLTSGIGRWELLLFEELEQDGNLLSQRDPLRLFVQAFFLQIPAYQGSERIRFLRRALRHPIRSNPRHMRDLLPLEDYDGHLRLSDAWLGARLLGKGIGVGVGVIRRAMNQ